ncbi:hypothetical protein EDD16DRAFT_1008874 [Pisolithus croceorrhizus]|nr:hypothetical protein EDD16DRAFT_1008874 [Pisolithus croceorrhizus]
MSNSWTTQLPRDLCHQQDCHLDHARHGTMSGDDYTIQRSQLPGCIVSSSTDNVPFPPAGISQAAGRVGMPSENAVGSRAFSMVSPLLNQASTSVPKYEDSPWGGRYTQANHPLSTPPTIYANEDGGSSIFEGRSTQLPRPTIPVPTLPFMVTALRHPSSML